MNFQYFLLSLTAELLIIALDHVSDDVIKICYESGRVKLNKNEYVLISIITFDRRMHSDGSLEIEEDLLKIFDRRQAQNNYAMACS